MSEVLITCKCVWMKQGINDRVVSIRGSANE